MSTSTRKCLHSKSAAYLKTAQSSQQKDHLKSQDINKICPTLLLCCFHCTQWTSRIFLGKSYVNANGSQLSQIPVELLVRTWIDCIFFCSCRCVHGTVFTERDWNGVTTRETTCTWMLTRERPTNHKQLRAYDTFCTGFVQGTPLGPQLNTSQKELNAVYRRNKTTQSIGNITLKGLHEATLMSINS